MASSFGKNDELTHFGCCDVIRLSDADEFDKGICDNLFACLLNQF